MPVVAAVLIEPENDPKKVLRVTLPLGMSIQPGTRVIVDSGQPMTGPYVICFNNGCMADYEASGELIGKLKKGQGLVIQGIDGAGHPISLVDSSSANLVGRMPVHGLIGLVAGAGIEPATYGL